MKNLSFNFLKKKLFILTGVFSILFFSTSFGQNYCKWCNKRMQYGNDFSVYSPGWGVLSYSNGEEHYEKNWQEENIKFCCSNHANAYADKVKAQEIAEDRTKYVPTKRICDYCAKTIYYKDLFCVKDGSTLKWITYSQEDPRTYNKIWRGSESSWDAVPKVIYHSKQCANEAP
jgi:hypothetical protein